MIAAARKLVALPALFAHPHLDPDALRSFQLRRLRQLVAYAIGSVGYYRELYQKAGIRPDDIKTLEDLAKLPIVERKTLQEIPIEERLAAGVDPGGLVIRRTSGSSGRPFAVYRSWIEERSLGLLRMRAMHDMGYRPTDRHVSVLLHHGIQKADGQLPVRLMRSIGLLRSTRIDCLQEPRAILQRLCEIQPDVITGFPGVLARVGVLAAEAGRPLRPRLITTGGETITPLMRRQIEEGFAAPLRDTYGAHEFNLIAWQCSQTGAMHTCDDGLIVEVLKDGKPVREGGAGELVATNLHSFSMPLIRYRLGDCVTRGSARCECGAPFGTLEKIQGRMIDYFHLPGGRVIHPWQIINSAYDLPNAVREIQMLQEHQRRVVLRIVPRRPLTAGELEAIGKDGHAALGPGVEFEVRLVDRIPLEATGKFRTSRSLVFSNYDIERYPTEGAA